MSVRWRLFWPGLALVVTVAAGLALRSAFLAAARRWTQPGSTVASPAAAVRMPSLLWVLLLGLWASVITNYDLPEPRLPFNVNVSVSHESDPDRVERVLVEEALRAAREVPGLPYSLDFTLTCQVATFVDQFLAQHELRKRILQRFRAEGIEIPLPTQVHVDGSGEARPLANGPQQGQRGDHRQS